MDDIVSFENFLRKKLEKILREDSDYEWIIGIKSISVESHKDGSFPIEVIFDINEDYFEYLPKGYSNYAPRCDCYLFYSFEINKKIIKEFYNTPYKIVDIINEISTYAGYHPHFSLSNVYYSIPSPNVEKYDVGEIKQKISESIKKVIVENRKNTFFQDMIDGLLVDIRNFCEERASAGQVYSFDVCDCLDKEPKIKVLSVYKNTDSNVFEVELETTFYYIRPYHDFDELYYELSGQIRKKTGFKVVFKEVKQHNTNTSFEW